MHQYQSFYSLAKGTRNCGLFTTYRTAETGTIIGRPITRRAILLGALEGEACATHDIEKTYSVRSILIDHGMAFAARSLRL